MGNGLYRASLDTRSIDTHHETSAELSKPPGHDGITSRYLLPVHTRYTPEGAKSVNFVTKSAPHTSSALQRAGLDIISVEQHLQTSVELSRPSGDDGITSRSLLPVHTEHHPPGSVKPPTSARYMGNGLYRAGFDIRPIYSDHVTPAEPSKSSEYDDHSSIFILYMLQNPAKIHSFRRFHVIAPYASRRSN